MRSKSNLPVFIGYALICLLVLGYMVTQMGGEFFLQSPYHFKAVFTSGSQLVAGDDVTIAGLRVGRVDSLHPGAGGTVADLIMHQDYAPLYSDSLAPPGQEASTYAGMLRYNARALAEGMRKN